MTPELDMHEGSGIRTAVDVLAINTEGKILLGLHRKSGKEVWGFVGGHQKTGETFHETAARELEEELGENHGVEVTGTIVAVRENCLPPWFVPHVTIILLAHWQEGTLKVKEPERTIQWAWYDPTALPAPLYSGVGEIVAAHLQHQAVVVTDWHAPLAADQESSESIHAT